MLRIEGLSGAEATRIIASLNETIGRQNGVIARLTTALGDANAKLARQARIDVPIPSLADVARAVAQDASDDERRKLQHTSEWRGNNRWRRRRRTCLKS